MIEHLTPRELAARLNTDDPPVVVDVRELWEHEVASLAGAVHIPLGTLPARIHELPADRRLVFLCHHGARSLHAAAWVASRGHAGVANLEGGIDEWSATVDPSIPRYA